MGREAKIIHGLTRKQFVFAQNILSGKSGTQAVLASYSTTNLNVAKVIASQNLNKLNIREFFNRVLNAQGLSLSVIISELAKLATSHPRTISAGVQLKTLIEILKIRGDYQEKRKIGTIPFRSKIDDIAFEESEARLNQLKSDTKRILDEAKGYTT